MSLNTFMPALTLLATLVLGACVASSPVITHDGLHSVPSKSFDAMYRKPDVDISAYRAIGLAPCSVSFRNNWLRDQNRSRLDLSNRVTQKHVDQIKEHLSAACEQHFRKALLSDPAYHLVDDFSQGEAVLVLRPSIIDLDINAPDLRSSTRQTTYTTSAGEMTLSLDLVDATSNEVLGRVVDRKRAVDHHRLQWTNSVTNSAEANRMLRSWALRLRAALDEARSQ
ncbi:DUF3313 family protein [Parahaliea sp. F7430]|uniref:DUF3313 family protein n=1 Tax=Sediminihaliea albiluteola TaxID=2758564 RepID=A0A7W2TV35_9GAMM|nr:DUF3313 family protein [Sediminihaliea albiluteola]MBA6412516.1 DUF3313 family protein [Sediminihaliea albiluteola]